MMRRIAQLLAGFVMLVAAIVLVRAILVTSAEPISPLEPVGEIDEHLAVQHLADALKFRTISAPPGGSPEHEAFHGLIGSFEQSFPLLHASLKREQLGNYSLLYTWQGTDPELPGVLFIAHTDVVPVDPEVEVLWTHAPFSGDISDGFVWGRGAIDMKSVAIGLLEATEHLLRQAVQPKRTVFLAFGDDEETGGRNGAAVIAETLRSRGVRLEYTIDEGSYVVSGVVSGVSRPVALIAVAEKGYLTLRLSAKGPGGHSSMPSRNEPVMRLARALKRLDDRPMPASLDGAVSPMFDALAGEMPFARRAVVANRWLFDPLLERVLERSAATNAFIRTTMAPTMIAGGIKENVLAPEANVTLNFRILPGDTRESVIAHVRETIGDPAVAIEQIGEGYDPSVVSSAGSQSFELLRSAVATIYPDAAVAPALVIGGTDSVHYANLAANSYRFEPLRLDASDLERIHGVDERIRVRDFVDMIKFYIAVLRAAAT